MQDSAGETFTLKVSCLIFQLNLQYFIKQDLIYMWEMYCSTISCRIFLQENNYFLLTLLFHDFHPK